MKPIEIGSVEDQIPLADSRDFILDVYRETGFFVMRGVIPEEQIGEWQVEWNRFYADKLGDRRKVDPFNPVHVSEQLPQALAQMHSCPELLDLMEVIYPDLALLLQRFVIKDHTSRNAVFVHQDFCYDYGWPEKTTVFIPLTVANKDNGGISIYPGTHHLGYLGDAGEVNLNILSQEWPVVCPSLVPGDVAMIHTCTWHFSPPHVRGPDRILAQATYQPASDPSSKVLLRGNWRARYRLADFAKDQFFTRCRSSRLRELQAQVTRLQSGARD